MMCAVSDFFNVDDMSEFHVCGAILVQITALYYLWLSIFIVFPSNFYKISHISCDLKKPVASWVRHCHTREYELHGPNWRKWIF